ncbi:HTTM domain-containing protein [Ilumatobacter nonamiensis]|uniref:HTTM domain-containing protein n=1 Tax=Ilumatobacter nonamiensis TaxID=467093 RepID=UPI0003489216|nr:HTTM domain-containing protein [Ilumatobacter nonamiensis]
MPTATADRLATETESAGRVSGRGLVPTLHAVRTAARRSVDARSTVAFRVAFGALIVYSTVRFVARGWVDEFYLRPEHHLTYPAFGWVHPLPAPWMYVHMGLLGALGVAIAVGFRPRISAALFALGFAYVELIDAALYLNHYWFVTLAAVALAIVPGPAGGRVPAVTVWVLRGQVAVVYVFAGIAKLNTDWLLHAQPMSSWLTARTDRPLIGPLLDEPAVWFTFSWFGAAFDLTIVGWLLWRRSRPIAYVAVVVFHVATAMLFQIGVFPWVMIALTPIFFSPDWPGRVWAMLSRRDRFSVPTTEPVRAHRIAPPTMAAIALLVAVNVVLPLRHYAAEGNVRFNDDGYYLSWRVMLTERSGFLEFTARDPATDETWVVRPDSVLADWQVAQAVQRPDLALSTAHLVAEQHAGQGRVIEVYANSWVAFNGRPRQRWIDPDVDLAALDRSSPASEYVLAESEP